MAFQFKKRKGTALVIAMMLIPVLLILAVSFVDPITRSYRAAAADQKRLMAKSIAENLFEQALFITKDLNIGENAQGCLGVDGKIPFDPAAPLVCSQQVDYVYAKATGKWSVFGQPEVDAEHLLEGSPKQYTVPSVGTGDVGGDFCSSAQPVYNTDTLNAAYTELFIGEDVLNADPSKWPCNWGKIKEGESISIPLYVEDADGNVWNPLELGLNSFQLRIRAACDPSKTNNRPYGDTVCGDGERYELVGDPGTTGIFILEKTIIVLWEITGNDTDENGEEIYLAPKYINNNNNSQIYVRSINNYELSTCMPNNLCESSIAQYQDTIVTIGSKLNILYKPTLRLMVIHTLKDGDGNKVPYLEYQFKANVPTSGKPPIANSSKIVKVEVMVDGGYSETIEKTIGLPKPVTGFVIQQ